MKSTSATNFDSSKRKGSFKKEKERLICENREKTRRIEELLQKYKVLQKENLAAESQTLQAEKHLQGSEFEKTRLTNELNEKEWLLKQVSNEKSGFLIQR